MESKTLEFLNSKVWYRLVKVFYSLIFIGILLFYNGLIFTNISVRRWDVNKTLVTCSNGEKFKLSDAGIGSLDLAFNENFDYNKFIGQDYYNAQKISDQCDFAASSKSTDPQEQSMLNQGWKVVSPAVPHSQGLDVVPGNTNIDFHPDNSSGNNLDVQPDPYAQTQPALNSFNIQVHYTYLYFISFFFLGNLAIILLFEGLRRSFYYVVLGSWRPKK